VVRLGNGGADLGCRIDREPLEHLRRGRAQRELPPGLAAWVHEHGFEDGGGEQVAELPDRLRGVLVRPSQCGPVDAGVRGRVLRCRPAGGEVSVADQGDQDVGRRGGVLGQGAPDLRVRVPAQRGSGTAIEVGPSRNHTPDPRARIRGMPELFTGGQPSGCRGRRPLRDGRSLRPHGRILADHAAARQGHERTTPRADAVKLAPLGHLATYHAAFIERGPASSARSAHERMELAPRLIARTAGSGPGAPLQETESRVGVRGWVSARWRCAGGCRW
jgi:hypothetical protein